VLKFRRDVFDLDQFAGPLRANQRQTSERSLSELLHPSEAGLPPQIRATYLAEANNRLSQPLYCLAFAMIALAAILRGRRQRGALAMRLTIASLSAAAIRITGYGIAGPAAHHPAWNGLFYLIPVLGMGLGLVVLMGLSPSAIWERRKRLREALA
jgi:lipopolysaccharide export system permease protein